MSDWHSAGEPPPDPTEPEWADGRDAPDALYPDAPDNAADSPRSVEMVLLMLGAFVVCALGGGVFSAGLARTPHVLGWLLAALGVGVFAAALSLARRAGVLFLVALSQWNRRQ